MWPWEHLAVGYLLYWGLVRLRGGDRVRGSAAFAVAFGTQFPDLVDKPLAWSLQALPSGVSLAHSVFTASILVVVVLRSTAALDVRHVGTAFVVGYLSHLPADLTYPLLLGEVVQIQAFLWPLTTVPGTVTGGFVDNFSYYLLRLLVFLGTPRGLLYLFAELALLAVALLAWRHDGYPGVELLQRADRYPQ